MISTLRNFNKYRKWINVFLSTYDHFVDQMEKEFESNNTKKDDKILS